jgi:two-component system chemotaxis response regulator CheB
MVVEDSEVVRGFLVHVLGSDSDIRVVATARDGAEAVDKAALEHPDVITMDINMPRMNGFEATRRIMETNPTPIVIVSGNIDNREVETTFRAVEAGAVAVLERPPGLGSSGFEAGAAELVKTVKLMSEVKLVRRWPRRPGAAAPRPVAVRPSVNHRIRVVAIGASTGGPPAINAVLSGLPRGFPVPVLIVQHIASGFGAGLAEWLSKVSGFPVNVATHGEMALPGRAYLAPDDFHLCIASGNRLALNRDEPVNGMRPSVSVLFRSLAQTFGGESAAVLLTGMGRDGAEAMRLLSDAGALTVAQDEDSSVVFGMPGAAVRLGAARHVLKPEQIAEALAAAVRVV